MLLESEIESQICRLRQVVSAKATECPTDFDSRDLDQFATNDSLVRRYVLHVDEGDGSFDDLCSFTVQSLKWRLETGIRDIVSSDFSPETLASTEMYVRNRDVDGKMLLVLNIREHVRSSNNADENRRFFLYTMENVLRLNNGDKISMVFDCQGCGQKNLDMDLIQYMINVFKDYIPYALNYILVVEMPWILSVAWKIIKTWLPPAGVRKIKFLTKANLTDFVPTDQVFKHWGGTIDTWTYEHERDSLVQLFASVDKNNNYSANHNDCNMGQDTANGPSGKKTKNVHFEEDEAIVIQTPRAAIKGSADQIVMVEPAADMVTFKQKPTTGMYGAVVALTNVDPAGRTLAFKIKTTSPDRYRVRPTVGVLRQDVRQTIAIAVANWSAANADGNQSPNKDKFLITIIALPDTPQSSDANSDGKTTPIGDSETTNGVSDSLNADDSSVVDSTISGDLSSSSTFVWDTKAIGEEMKRRAAASIAPDVEFKLRCHFPDLVGQQLPGTAGGEGSSISNIPVSPSDMLPSEMLTSQSSASVQSVDINQLRLQIVKPITDLTLATQAKLEYLTKVVHLLLVLVALLTMLVFCTAPSRALSGAGDVPLPAPPEPSRSDL